VSRIKIASNVPREPTGETSGTQKTGLIRVLQVDADSGILRITKEILALTGGIEVSNARFVEDAFKKISQEEFDVIVSDYKMPGKDGLEFLQELREKGNKIPFIIFTGKGKEEVAAKALNLGAFRYLNKNGDTEAVYAELASAIQQASNQARSEKIVQEKTRLNQILLDGMPCVALLLRARTREIVFSNRLALAVGAVPGKQCFSSWWKRSTPCPWCLAPRMWETGKMQRVEVEEKGVFWDVYWIPVSPDLYMHFAFDITELKKAEEALRLSEATHRELINGMNDTAWVIDYDAKFIDVNNAAVKVLGYSREEFMSGPAVP
jgi:DNA-binding NarL/FixJ family response regulator